jgi:tetratricopeptide (TPR) repeat protein
MVSSGFYSGIIACHDLPRHIYMIYRAIYLGIILTCLFVYSAEAEISNTRMAEIHVELGMQLMRESEYEKACPHFQEAIGLMPTWWIPYFEMGICARVQHMPLEQIASYFNQAIQRNPNHVWSYVYLGQSQEQYGQNEKAIENYQWALKLYPDLPDVQYRVAFLYSISERSYLAKKTLLDLLKTNPDFVKARMLLFDLYEKEHNPEDAEKVLQSMIDHPTQGWFFRSELMSFKIRHMATNK